MAVWFLLAIGAGLLGAALAAIVRPRWVYPAAAAGGALVGAGIAAQPTLFRAENGFWLAFMMYGVPSVVVALVGGGIVKVVQGEFLPRREQVGKQ